MYTVVRRVACGSGDGELLQTAREGGDAVCDCGLRCEELDAGRYGSGSNVFGLRAEQPDVGIGVETLHTCPRNRTG